MNKHNLTKIILSLFLVSALSGCLSKSGDATQGAATSSKQKSFSAAFNGVGLPAGPITFDPPSPSFSTEVNVTGGFYPELGTATHITFFRDEACTIEIGSGVVSDFEGVGVLVRVLGGNVTSIYARSDDNSTGKTSPCVFLDNYESN